MSGLPKYPYDGPAGPDRGQESSKGPVPGTVILAVRMMYAGAVVSAASLIIGLATSGNLRAAIKSAARSSHTSLTPSQLTTETHVLTAFLVVVGVIGVGLWIWMAVLNRRGRNWARITGTVFFGLSTIELISGFAQHTDAIAMGVTILVWLIGLTAVVLLWQPASSAYFRAPRYLR